MSRLRIRKPSARADALDVGARGLGGRGGMGVEDGQLVALDCPRGTRARVDVELEPVRGGEAVGPGFVAERLPCRGREQGPQASLAPRRRRAAPYASRAQLRDHHRRVPPSTPRPPSPAAVPEVAREVAPAAVGEDARRRRPPRARVRAGSRRRRPTGRDAGEDRPRWSRGAGSAATASAFETRSLRGPSRETSRRSARRSPPPATSPMTDRREAARPRRRRPPGSSREDVPGAHERPRAPVPRPRRTRPRGRARGDLPRRAFVVRTRVRLVADYSKGMN